MNRCGGTIPDDLFEYCRYELACAKHQCDEVRGGAVRAVVSTAALLLPLLASLWLL